MAFNNALNACFKLHELNHAHWAEVNDDGFAVAREDAGIPGRGHPHWKDAPPIEPARRDNVRAEA